MTGFAWISSTLRLFFAMADVHELDLFSAKVTVLFVDAT